MGTGCFHILAIVSNAARITGMRVSFQISVFILKKIFNSSAWKKSYDQPR